MPHQSDRPQGELADVVIDLAQRSFIDHGIRGTKMEQLARTAGVSVGQLYQLFANKEALLLAVHGRAQARMFDEYLTPAYALTPPEGAIVHLQEICRAYLRFCLDHKDMARLLFGETYDDRHDADIARVLDDISARAIYGVGEMARIIRDGVARGEIRPIDAEATVRWYWGALFGVMANNLRIPATALDDDGLWQVIEVGLESLATLLRPA